MKVREWIPVALIGAAVVLGVAGCGNEEQVRYSDKQIIDKLNLDKSPNGYILDGDQFCEVESQLFNDRDQVEEALDHDKLGLVIASRQGNVGVKGVPVFPVDCGDKAQKKLNRLDPKPAE